MNVQESLQSLQRWREDPNFLNQVQTSYESSQEELTQQLYQAVDHAIERQVQSEPGIQNSSQNVSNVNPERENQDLLTRVQNELAELRVQQERLQEELKNAQAKLRTRQQDILPLNSRLQQLQKQVGSVPSRRRGEGFVKAGTLASQLLSQQIQQGNKT